MELQVPDSALARDGDMEPDAYDNNESILQAPTVNGDHIKPDLEAADAANNHDSFILPSSLPNVEPSLSLKSASAAPDPNPAGPTPVEDVAEGIQPVADFVPKDTAPFAHPTPPPEQPLGTGEADVDMEMPDTDASAPQQPVQAPPQLLQPMSGSSFQVHSSDAQTAQEDDASTNLPLASTGSLVRPREDGEDDEPVAKRSKVEDDGSMAEPTSTIQFDAVAATNEPDDLVVPLMVDATASRDAGLDDAQNEVKASQFSDAPDAPMEPQTLEDDARQAPISTKSPLPPLKEGQQDATKLPASTLPSEKPKYDTRPMTEYQRKLLLEKTKNLKKTKNSVHFLKPVDYVTLQIPSYPETVKHPMDLSTMERKLKDNEYKSLQDYADDFDLIVNNCRLFNGDTHPITGLAMNLEAYFRRSVMDAIPPADAEVAQPKQAKRDSLPKAQPRPSRAAATAASPTSAETFALQPDGTPQIRRDSNMNRPARTIKPPANRELTYAKPKRKEHMLELRWCEHALDLLRGPRYAQINHVFLNPVDPVALNIPHYRQVVKKPMDLSTMGQKLKQGQYATANEFRKDFELMIDNCLAFNPSGNPVRDMGIQFRRQFEQLWSEKDQWERQHKPISQRGSPDDDDVDEDEGDDNEPEDEKDRRIRELQQQLSIIQNSLASMVPSNKPSQSSKKEKKKTSSSKKSGATAAHATKQKAVPAKKSSTKKEKELSYEEKQEISQAVEKMSERGMDNEMSELTTIIIDNEPKYANQTDMELEIDNLKAHTQVLLLQFVRKVFPKPKKTIRSASPDDAAAADDDDFEPDRRTGGAGRRKKHKPMSEQQQQETISALKSRLSEFEKASGSEEPTSDFNAAQQESSGDESEESEEE